MTKQLFPIVSTQSNWLKRAKADLLMRDPVDAVNDVEALLLFAQQRFDALISKNSDKGPLRHD